VRLRKKKKKETRNLEDGEGGCLFLVVHKILSQTGGNNGVRKEVGGREGKKKF